MSAQRIIKLVINLSVEGPMLPESLFAAHRAAEDAAGKTLGAAGATSVVTLPGTMSKAAAPAPRNRRRS